MGAVKGLDEISEILFTMINWLRNQTGGEVTIVIEVPGELVRASSDPAGVEAALRKALTGECPPGAN